MHYTRQCNTFKKTSECLYIFYKTIHVQKYVKELFMHITFVIHSLFQWYDTVSWTENHQLTQVKLEIATENVCNIMPQTNATQYLVHDQTSLVKTILLWSLWPVVQKHLVTATHCGMKYSHSRQRMDSLIHSFQPVAIEINCINSETLHLSTKQSQFYTRIYTVCHNYCNP